MNGKAVCLPLTLNKKILPGLERIGKMAQPFRPPRATPRTMYLRANRNRMTTGKTTTVDAAISSSG